MRKIKFQNNYYYHIFNRGVDKRNIFDCDKNFIRFIKSIREFNNNSTYASRDYEKRMRAKMKLSFGYPKLSFMTMPKYIDIICYTLIPNHYHFIFKQLQDNVIEKFMHKLDLGYTKYFNYKYSRTGSLLQGTYQVAEIKNEHKLIQLSCYINGNPEIHGICKAKNWQWSSYRDYLNLRKGTLCNKNIILNQFENINEYKKLTKNIIKESKKRKQELKNYILE